MKDKIFTAFTVFICGICLGLIIYTGFNFLVFLESYSNEVLNGVSSYDYFKDHLEEYEIVDSSIGYSRSGKPTFNIYTKHLPSEMYYDFQVSYDNYMRLNKLISCDKE